MFCATRAHSRTVLHHLRHRHGLKHQARGARNVHGGGPVVIGIRREDPLRIWERRCPLTPEAVQTLIQDEGFKEVGAMPHNSLEPAHVILGIKEVPMAELLTSPVPSASGSSQVARTQIMFSHTIKGQSYNMPLLAKFLDSTHSSEGGLLPTLLDWELFTDRNGKRTCGFGWYAGVAGALEGLVATAHLFLELGVATPFLATPRPHTAPISSLRNSLHDMGRLIRGGGLPRSIGPFVICVTGSGQVSNGALSLLNELPVKSITKDELPNVVMDPNTPLNQIYLLHATQEVYLKNKLTGKVAREDYYANPSKYQSNFHETIAPYVSLLINGVGWSPQFPRLMSNDQLVAALERVQLLRSQLQERPDEAVSRNVDIMTGRCQSFADISCDVHGGLEFLPLASTLSDPYFTYRPPFFPSHLPALKIMSVDILPTALPLDASEAFSNSCLPYIRALVRQYKVGADNTGFEREVQALNRAKVAEGGELVGKHEWLQEKVKTIQDSQDRTVTQPSPASGELSSSAAQIQAHRKTVLLLGSGMVAKPAVDELCSRDDINVIIASDNTNSNEQLAYNHPNASTATFSMHQEEKVNSLVQKADVVISLLPVQLHPIVAELCIKHKKHLVTASYISPEMKALHLRAANAGVLLLNEIGLDPGIDHCSALEILSSLRKQNKEVVSFTSFCGGLPAPEHADVPLRYKFSWSPAGVLKAALNGAKFIVGGKEIRVRPEDLLKRPLPNLPLSDVLKLEGIPNRDSVSYEHLYTDGRKGELTTLFRGTLRYHGYSDLLHTFKSIGLLNTNKAICVSAWSSLALQSLEMHLETSIKDEASFISALGDVVPASQHGRLVEALYWLGALPTAAPRSATIPLPTSSGTHLEHFATLLSHQLKLEPHERDLVVMHHEVCTRSDSNKNRTDKVTYDEVHSATLQVYGKPGETAMARCVGLPVAFSALKILDEQPTLVGVCGPTDPALFTHVLEQLARAGIKMETKKAPYRHSASVTRTLLKTFN